MNEEDLIKQRKEKIVNFVKEKYNLLTYAILAVLVFFAVKIRSSNISKLKDVTTDSWTLGPDLDPFLFLRYAKYIVENGTLFALDTMRYVPLGYETKAELLLHPHMMAIFHNISSIFHSQTITYSAIIYPVFFFALTVIAFFFLARKIFISSLGVKRANIIALIASFFLTVIPVILPRTIAGIPEKESAAFFFLFLSLYLFLSAWQSHKLKNQILIALLAGLSTAAMGLIWGGYGYIYLIISLTLFVSFFLGKTDKNKVYLLGTFLVTSILLINSFTIRYSLKGLLTSTTTGSTVFLFIVILFHHFITKDERFSNYITLGKLDKNIPTPVKSFIFTFTILLIPIFLFLGPGFFTDQINNILSNLISPARSRLIQTVAENKQPFFSEWANNFGPQVNGIPLFFWLFFTGSIYLFYNTLKGFKKNHKIILSSSYTFFLIAIIFSRYSQQSTFNGTNFASILFYTLGPIILLSTIIYYYKRYYYSENRNILSKIDIGAIMLLSFFLLGIVSARGAVRIVMMLVPPTSIIVSYFVVSTSERLFNKKGLSKNIILNILIILLIASTIFSGFQFYKQTSIQAENYAPSIYHHQWQNAMSWVRENTSENAVFGHWWDYGYWVQSIGNRATILDGGNAISYWNHLMGRHVLTSTNNKDSAEFLYAHNATHLLIDSSDIGKYSAYSKIGSDENHDRESFIPTFKKDNAQTQERKNSELHVYTGGAPTDEDIIYESNGSRVFLPSGKTILAALLIEIGDSGTSVSAPQGVFIDRRNGQNKQITLPLRYAYDTELRDFNTGIDAGVFIYPSITDDGQISLQGTSLYLSPRTINSGLARLYLFNEENEYFNLEHSETDTIVQNVNSQLDTDYEFVHYPGQGLRGPIKIWSVNYPESIEFKPEYIETEYPPELKFT